MPTRKNIKSKKSNKRFRKTRSKRQTRKSNKKKSKKRGGGQVPSTIFNIEPDSPPLPPLPPPECPICTEDFNDNSITTKTSCKHIFHTDCIRRWCRQHREATNCPLCREPIGRMCRELLFTDLEKVLFDAIKKGEINFAEEALQRGVDDTGETLNPALLNINIKDKNGYTPLILAAEKDEVEIVELLLYYGADVNELNDNRLAAYHVTSDDGIVNLLLEYGYEPDENQEDAAVEASIFGFGNNGGKRKQKKNKKKV